MKSNLVIPSWIRRLLAGILFVVVSGCATEAPVSPAPVTGDQPGYNQIFDTAVKAMKKMGTVQFENRERGTISGSTPSGVILEVEIIRDTGPTPQLQVQARLPEGMTDMGNINEPDRYLDIYRQLSLR